jgi:hypothetical protein
MEIKRCGKCGLDKTIEEFWKNKKEADGLQYQCIECMKKYANDNIDHRKNYLRDNKEKINSQSKKRRKNKKDQSPVLYEDDLKKHKIWLVNYRKTPEGKAGNMWSGMNGRIKHHKDYKDVLVKMNRQEFVEWAIPEVKKFMELNPNEVPSLDRIDYTGHYEFGNIRIIGLTSNVLRSRMLMKKLKLSADSSSQEVFARLTESVLSVCEHTSQSAKEYCSYLQKVLEQYRD